MAVDIVQYIAGWLGQHDLPDQAIAAILGNMQIESSFNTGALNGREGAIGLVQWEGGRRAALQQFAAQRGTSETDLNTQLEFMWHELTTSYRPALDAIMHAPDAATAAAAYDAQYEVSSGSSRQQRIDAATAFAQNGFHGGAAVSASTAAGSDITSSAYADSASSGTANLTPEQKKEALIQGAGPLGALLTRIPELSQLLNEAITQGWTAPEFQNKITNTEWYRTHSDAVRQNLILQVSDPASYKQQLTTASQKVSNLMAQMGISTQGMSQAQYVALSKQVMMGTISDQELQKDLAGYFAAGTGKYGQNYKEGSATGQAATYDTQLREMYAQYGQTPQAGQMAYRVRQMLSGAATLDQYKEQAQVAAKAMFPGLSSSIDQGMTVKDLAQPYIQSMSNLLELDPNSISLNDRLVKGALQGTGQAVSKGQQPTATPLYQFEQQLRSDPRWQYTKNAHDTTSAMLLDLGKSWGFAS